MSFEKILENHIKIRNWVEIREKWIDFLPSINPSGSPPIEALTDSYDFNLIAKEISGEENHFDTKRQEIQGFRQIVFWEGLYWLHKASHVIGSAEVHVKNGILTWSLSNAYHGAFFGIKGIMNLLGIALPEYNNKAILVDIWPLSPKLSTKERKLGITPPLEMEFKKLGKRLDHLDTWKIFQRLIRILKIDIWPKEFISFLRHLETKKFAKQRNTIHYRNNAWVMNDLHDYIIDNNFGVRKKDFNILKDIDDDNNDFTLMLSYIILNLGYLLVNNFNDLTNKLENETKLLANEKRHPLYQKVFC